MAAYIDRMPCGIPGDVSRRSESTAEAGLMAADMQYGAPVKLDATGKLVALAGADDTVYGFIVRPYPSQETAAAKGSVQDVMRRGYMTVKLKQGTSAKGGAVYARHKAASGKLVGDIEAADDAGNTLKVPNCIFMGEADGDGNVEIAFNL